MGLGRYALLLADRGLRQAGLVPDPVTPEDTLADVPVVKAFVVRYPSAGSASIQRFYDEFERNQRYYTSFMARAKEGDIAAMQHILDAGGPLMFVQLTNIRTALAEHAQFIRNINKNPAFSSSDQRQQIDSAYFRMVELAAGGVAAMRRFDEALQQQPQPGAR